MWRVVSSDGHPISGDLTFTINDSNAAGGTTSENEGDDATNEQPAEGTGDNNADNENAADTSADTDASATANEDNGGISPIAYVVIALGAVGVVALVIVMFRRKSRGLEQ